MAKGRRSTRIRSRATRASAQLHDLIGKTMPEDDPGTLSKHDAEAVATFVYDAIYSPVARRRNRPARIELARLTVDNIARRRPT